ncbi:MAG: Rieske 2Fe-2S domain-containing protein [Leptospiraceae bacterium]|nr:Rieske 2Fe-2S domain-containing protein [Leptospiraceae bacterium]
MDKFVWNHWHPLILSKNLKKKPQVVKILSEDILVFRDKNNNLHALKNECPHRRMALNEGTISKDGIVCPYHGWQVSGNGTCLVASTGEQLKHTHNLEVKEELETIWVRKPSSNTEFPKFDLEGYRKIHFQENIIKAPLEIVLDNFTETEHTSSVHAFLGYSEEELKNVNVKLTTTETTVQLYNEGQQKPIPWIIRHFLKLSKTDIFIDDWITFFSPIYSVYDQYWLDSRTRNERHDKLRIYVFFVPVDSHTTRIFAYTFMKYHLTGNFGLNIFVKPAMTWIVEKEVSLDKNMIEKIQNQEISLKGTKLTRFDKALGPNRSRIQKIYYGIEKEKE